MWKRTVYIKDWCLWMRFLINGRLLDHFLRSIFKKGAFFKKTVAWSKVDGFCCTVLFTFRGRDRYFILSQVPCSRLLGKKKNLGTLPRFSVRCKISWFCLLLHFLWPLSLLFLLSFLCDFLSVFHNSKQKWHGFRNLQGKKLRPWAVMELLQVTRLGGVRIQPGSPDNSVRGLEMEGGRWAWREGIT